VTNEIELRRKLPLGQIEVREPALGLQAVEDLAQRCETEALEQLAQARRAAGTPLDVARLPWLPALLGASSALARVLPCAGRISVRGSTRKWRNSRQDFKQKPQS